MKKLIVTAVAAFSMQVAFAQNGAITNASLHLKNGKLDLAKAEIDKAVVHEKTANSAKAWFMKGEVYSTLGDPNIMALQKPEVKALSAGALEEASAAYEKAITLDKPNGEFSKKSTEKRKELEDKLFANAFNEGGTLFNLGRKIFMSSLKDSVNIDPGAPKPAAAIEKYQAALASFTKAQKYRPSDQTAILYAAASAEQIKNWSAAKENYSKLISLGQNKPEYYSRLYYITRDEEKNAQAAQKILQDALAVHPNNKEFMQEDLSLTISSGKGAESIAKLEKAIQADPKNTTLYIVLGTTYENTGKKDLAQATYEKALKVDAGNFDANFNLGVLHFNKAADLSRKYNKMDYATQKKVGAKMTTDINNHFKAALPYFETAHKTNPNDVNTMETLAKIYINLGRTKDAEAMNKKVDALKK